jgi:N-acetyl-gamma-glutamyl-phosphate reductase
MKIRVGVVGISGYAGFELIHLILRHPAMELAAAMDVAELCEKPVHDVHPGLRDLCNLVVFPPDSEHIAPLQLDTVFLCTPDKVSYELVPKILSIGVRVVDFSGSFRLKNVDSYSSWYGFQHANPELLNAAVYGLPEWNAKAIAHAKLIANPGCYPTSVLLPLLPLIRAGMIETGSDIFSDSKSGVTGAGRAPKQELHFAEVADNFRPYSPIKHRHAPEMCQEMEWDLNNFTFVPHLLPIPRGILSTIYVRFQQVVSSAEMEAEYERRYAKRSFVRILGGSRLPELKAVNHTNFCDIGWKLTAGGRRAVLFSAIDNLGKGAASQAVQNFNIMHELDEKTGLLGGLHCD